MSTTPDAVEAPEPPTPRAAFWRRLAGQAARGAAGAVGSGLVSWVLWWFRGH
ncbi:hypothetical protein ACPYPG_21950 [Streptomyces sp. FR-108]|uniref:hypothetical protein n=1 Tax=Streptomyces sp. FR-108 TaxID=3416665 RepID=UPI003CEFE993